MDSNTTIKQEEEDVFDRLPNHLLQLIFNKVHDAKSLTNFLAVSKRFYSLIPTQTHTITLTLKNTPLHLKNNQSTNSSHSIKPNPTKHNYPITRLLNNLFFKPLKSLIKIRTTKNSYTHAKSEEIQETTFDLVNQALTTFESIKSLQIQLPSIGVETEPNLLKWKAEFGTKLETCVILGATSSCIRIPDKLNKEPSSSSSSYFSEDELKVRVVWVISCLLAASARHYMVGELVKKHKEIEKVVISDGSKQGKICMDKTQVEELRECEHGAEDVLAERSKVPGLKMKVWYVPELELKLENGSVMVFKGATLVVVRPKEEGEKWGSDKDLVKGAFGDEGKLFHEAAMKMVKKKKMYTLEMNSF